MFQSILRVNSLILCLIITNYGASTMVASQEESDNFGFGHLRSPIMVELPPPKVIFGHSARQLAAAPFSSRSRGVWESLLSKINEKLTEQYNNNNKVKDDKFEKTYQPKNLNNIDNLINQSDGKKPTQYDLNKMNDPIAFISIGSDIPGDMTSNKNRRLSCWMVEPQPIQTAGEIKKLSSARSLARQLNMPTNEPVDFLSLVQRGLMEKKNLLEADIDENFGFSLPTKLIEGNEENSKSPDNKLAEFDESRKLMRNPTKKNHPSQIRMKKLESKLRNVEIVFDVIQYLIKLVTNEDATVDRDAILSKVAKLTIFRDLE